MRSALRGGGDDSPMRRVCREWVLASSAQHAPFRDL